MGTSLEMPGGTPAPTYNKYRPPAGFSQEESNEWEQLDASLKAMDSNQLMDMLSTQSGYWHTLGKVIPLLNRAGFDTKLLEDISGIDSRVQNQWMISGSVYDSLVISGLFTKEEVRHASACCVSQSCKRLRPGESDIDGRAPRPAAIIL